MGTASTMADRALESVVPALSNRVRTLMREQGVPGVALGIVRDQALAWAGGFGYADLASARPLDEHSVFAVASITKTVTGLAIDTMSQWLDALVKDASAAPAIEKVVRAKPKGAVDGCFTADGTRIDEPLSATAAGRCLSLYPPHSTPRLVAGAPLADDVLKCELKPIDARDYKTTFTADQIRELRQIFPGGVCDYSKPGVNQKPLGGTYQRLPLTAAPVSRTTAASRQ